MANLEEPQSFPYMHRDEGQYVSKQNEVINIQALPNDVYYDTNSTGESRSKKWTIYTGIIISSVAVPLIGLTIWLARTEHKERRFNTFSGDVVGGRLTQPQAKAIDVICSAVLAPAIMAALNFFWFAVARVSTVNERHTRKAGLPLAALIGVSQSFSGSYNVFLLNNLRKGRSWRFLMLAGMLLLSALAKTALSNLIAYEAYSHIALPTNVGSLRYLSDLAVNQELPRIGLATQTTSPFGFSTQQQSSVANQITGLLTGLSFANATSSLTDEAYIGVNATSAAMSSLPSDIVSLNNVPGFRLTVDCTPDTPTMFSVMSTSQYVTKMSATWEYKVAAGYTGNAYDAYFASAITELQNSYTESYPFAAFLDYNSTEVFLSFMYAGFDIINDTVPVTSSYGDIYTLTQNMSAYGFSGTKETMKLWGLRCWLNRQEGLLNYTRTSSLDWQINASSFSNETRKATSFLTPWQSNLMYRAPQSTVAGIAPALAQSAAKPDSDLAVIGDPLNATDFKILALNYLYASGEAQRMTYEVAATNTSNDEPDFFYNVTGQISEQKYRITYIPIILLIGLLALVIAAALPAAMTMYVSKTISARTFRDVDAVRLLVDAADGLHEEAKDISNLGHGNGDMEKWVDDCKVEYQQTIVDGEIRFKLRPVDKLD
ncbi:hypothetical protein BP6252_13895 [Coleophoma cylindrospora]|uniref:Uncharacterized protein n=1 Tax=Coleophoma cylindrospora TaxID=1849047 RepID=A0A3D8Q5D8_9HELO|nr:hypothetical protein BP6252_13895 [Coleophoma cylindrospora]